MPLSSATFVKHARPTVVSHAKEPDENPEPDDKEPSDEPEAEDAEPPEDTENAKTLSDEENAELLPPELHNREFMDYSQEAYGRNDVKANTQTLKGEKEDQVNPNQMEGTSVADIMSQLKGDWNTCANTGQSDLGKNPMAEQEDTTAALKDVDVIDEPGGDVEK